MAKYFPRGYSRHTAIQRARLLRSRGGTAQSTTHGASPWRHPGNGSVLHCSQGLHRNPSTASSPGFCAALLEEKRRKKERNLNMCDMCNGMTRKQVEAKADRQIRDHGRVVIFVEPDRMSQPFAYTVGLSRIGHPEFIVERAELQKDSIQLLNGYPTLCWTTMRFSRTGIPGGGKTGHCCTSRKSLPGSAERAFHGLPAIRRKHGTATSFVCRQGHTV